MGRWLSCTYRTRRRRASQWLIHAPLATYGDALAKAVSQVAAGNGKGPSRDKRTRPFNASGAEFESEQAGYGCKIPIVPRHFDAAAVLQGVMSMLAISKLDLPGLTVALSWRQWRSKGAMGAMKF